MSRCAVLLEDIRPPLGCSHHPSLQSAKLEDKLFRWQCVLSQGMKVPFFKEWKEKEKRKERNGTGHNTSHVNTSWRFCLGNNRDVLVIEGEPVVFPRLPQFLTCVPANGFSSPSLRILPQTTEKHCPHPQLRKRLISGIQKIELFQLANAQHEYFRQSWPFGCTPYLYATSRPFWCYDCLLRLMTFKETNLDPWWY